MDCRNFQRTHADDGIHDTVTFNEYRPHGSWLEWYRRKDNLRDTLLALAIFLVYVTGCTLSYYWG